MTERYLRIIGLTSFCLGSTACTGSNVHDEDDSGFSDPSAETGQSGSTTSGIAGSADDETSGSGDATQGDEAPGDDTEAPPPPLCGPEAPHCVDEMILDLGLNEVVSDAVVGNEQDGDDWLTMVDATAGGLPNQASNPWVYVRFSPTGAQRVDIDDIEALSSDAWHLAAKRFGLRVNSGVSGPSCVEVAALPIGTYDGIDTVPAEDAFAVEHFYDADCELQTGDDDDGGFLAPDYLMNDWWSYPGCVATTLMPFVLQLPDGTAIKLVVEAYYGQGQDTCNASGTMGQDPANFTWRWRYLE